MVNANIWPAYFSLIYSLSSNGDLLTEIVDGLQSYISYLDENDAAVDISKKDRSDDCFYIDSVKDIIEKGLSIYKKINPGKNIEDSQYKVFIDAVRSLITVQNGANLIFKSDSVRLKILYKNSNFTVDYDYGENDSVFIMRCDDDLVIKECSLDAILPTLESYFVAIPERITSAA